MTAKAVCAAPTQIKPGQAATQGRTTCPRTPQRPFGVPRPDHHARNSRHASHSIESAGGERRKAKLPQGHGDPEPQRIQSSRRAEIDQRQREHPRIAEHLPDSGEPMTVDKDAATMKAAAVTAL